ncbi:MAG: IlvD/Edd family dehydratase [Phreatobacter sp.]|nr:IlvD/Edd family dehydratase [Phreatobacter sp.]
MAKSPTSRSKAPRGMRKGLTAYGDPGFSLFLRKAFIKAAGFSDDALDRPIIGITDTYSDYNPCHGNVRQLVEAVKRGVMLSGGLPFAFPTVSIHESFSNPTSMFLRNLMAIDTEEMIRAQPMDAVVLIGGCDKTVPAQLMGAASADVPAIQLITGPMLVGHYKGEVLGACTDCRRLWAMHRAGTIDEAEIEAVSGRLAPTVGTCMVMGTASTMGCLTEALGMALPHTGTIPATHADRIRAAEASGREAVKMAAAGRKPKDVITQASLRNAMVVLQAIGGSTNAIVHLAALPGRHGLTWDHEEHYRLGREVPVLLDLKPAGSNYMEHFHWSGGVPRLLQELRGHLDLDAPTVTGERLGDWVDRAEQVPGQTIIRSLGQPLKKTGAHAVLRGSLAPGGAVIKAAAATPKLMVHTGRAVVFEDVEDMTNRIDDPDLDVTADDILVMRNAGPKGHPGMPEAGLLPIPKKLAQQGVTDMIRISDARMSGTAYGTIVLHVTPEAAEGSPLALVRSGDRISLDVPNRRVDLLVSEEELALRRKAWRKPKHMRQRQRGYKKLYLDHVTQADKGCDFDFLEK